MGIVQEVARMYFSYFPIEKGKWFLWQLFNSRCTPCTPAVIECPLKYGISMRLNTGDKLDYFIYYWRCWEPNETWLIRKILRPGDTFVDIGANIGYFSLIAGKIVGAKGQVHAFEPVPSTVEKLRHNVAINKFTNIMIHDYALSDKEGSVRINQLLEHNPGMNSMRADVSGTGRFWDIPSKPLDRVLAGSDPIKLVKIDVEGAEMLVLNGFRKHLTAIDAPAILCEVTGSYLRSLGSSPEELFNFMNELGYRGYLLDNLKLTPASHSDLLALCTNCAPNVLFSKTSPLG